jgi:carbon monoxide dehydrogenase subunit G
VQFSGTVTIHAPRDRVWAFVDDPHQVGSCAPGVESVDVHDDGTVTAHAKVTVGPMSFRFDVAGEYTERVEPERAAVRGRARAPGTAVDGTSQMSLRDADDGGTIMDWSADVQFSGTIANIGARLIRGTANRLIAEGFSCVKSRLEGDGHPDG